VTPAYVRWQLQHCTAVETASSSAHDLRFGGNLAKATTAAFYLCPCSKGRLQRSLGVDSDSFSNSAGQGASASSSPVLQHQCSASAVSPQQQHLYFTFVSSSTSAAGLAAAAFSIRRSSVCTAAAYQHYLRHPQQQFHLYLEQLRAPALVRNGFSNNSKAAL
jgi:hypothetical protein